MPLAEKYSRRNNFRRMGFRFAVRGSLRGDETVYFRFAGPFDSLDSRAKHLRQISPLSNVFEGRPPNLDNMPSLDTLGRNS